MSDPANEHRHSYAYLRQEVAKDGDWKRDTFDVFYCQGCCEYRRVRVKTEHADGNYTYRITWRKEPADA